MRHVTLALAALVACFRAAAAADVTLHLVLPPQAAAALAGTAVRAHHLQSGATRHTYPAPDGRVTLSGLDVGSHILDIVCLEFPFQQYRVDVGSAGSGEVAMQAVESRAAVASPFRVAPMGRAQYYLQRKPFDIKSFLFSGYGLMLVAGVLILVVAPNMKMDPEELAAARSEMKDHPLGFLMGAGAGGAGAASGGATASGSAGGAPQPPALAAASSKRKGSGSGSATSRRR